MGVARPELAPAASRPARPRAVRDRPAGGALAVALHGIEPGHAERCALVRDWLLDLGVRRATLLVVPARDMHPIGQRSPALVDWLRERREAGDEIAQHGLRHNGSRAGDNLIRSYRGRASARSEFAGLSLEETRRRLASGWRLLKLADIEPQGFVAPAYGYTRELRAALDGRYDWWADMRSVGLLAGERVSSTSALGLSSAGSVARLVSPALVRIASRLPRRDVRVDIHLADLDTTASVRALESAVEHLAQGRTAVTYGELARR